MNASTKKGLLDGIDVEGLIEKSVTAATKRLTVSDHPKEAVDESYVAEPKSYRQVSEFMSQKAKDAHIKLYEGYVETLNRVSAELDTASRGEADSKHSAFRSLKLDETCNLNSVWLHELFFANCFDPHSEITMDSSSYIELERSWGTFNDWQADFMACGIACGQGWAVCGYNVFLKRYVNTFVSNHSQDVMLGLYPLIVIDMHEHVYSKDYQTDEKSYLVAMMKQLNWSVIEERVEKTKKLVEVVK